MALSFSDSDLAALAQLAWRVRRLGPGSACPPASRGPGAALRVPPFPELRLAALRDLRHPMSVDLWADRVAAGAGDAGAAPRRLRLVELRLRPAGGAGARARHRAGAAARRVPRGDARLAALSTVPEAEQAALLACFREGGPENMRALLARLAALAAARRREAPAGAAAAAGRGAHAGRRRGARARCARGDRVGRRWRCSSTARCCWRATCPDRRAGRGAGGGGAGGGAGLRAEPARCGGAGRAGAGAARGSAPAAIVTATAFAAGEAAALFARLGAPVFQVVPATTRREAWAGGARGLAPADLAMHVVLPELDGRILAGAISFKEAGPVDDRLGLGLQVEPAGAGPDRPGGAADRGAAAAGVDAGGGAAARDPDPGLSGRARAHRLCGRARRAGERAGDAADLKAAGYAVEAIPETPRDLMRPLASPAPALALADYRALAAGLPAAAREAVAAAWGEPEAEADTGGPSGFRVRAVRQRDGGAGPRPRAERRPAGGLPRPGAAAAACAARLRALAPRMALDCHALVHVGAHGTLEWLPGKTVALSAECFPELVAGALPVVYPFIVSNPGEAAQAKRRIGAVTLGHLTPPLAGAGLGEAERELERLVDEYAQADGLDRRRRERLAGLIVATARETGLAGEAGVGRGRRPGGGAGPDRRLALRPQGLRDQGRPARLRPRGAG